MVPDADVIHVWEIDFGSVTYEEAAPLLSVREQARASRLRTPEKRREFAATRACLRKLLSIYLDSGPDAFDFSYNVNGKPSLEGSELRFNASHSEHLALIAIAESREVGVDVEFIEDSKTHDDGWTGREAYVKARGWAMPLDPIPVEPGWRVLRIDQLPGGYTGSIAAEGESWRYELKPILAKDVLAAQSLPFSTAK